MLPSGRRLAVRRLGRFDRAAAFKEAATAALTVDAAVTEDGRHLVARRVVVGKPPYEPIADTLRLGFAGAGGPMVSGYDVSARAAFQRLDGRELAVLTIPIRQAEESRSAAERQYALLLPDTLYMARDDAGVRQITLAEAQRIIARDPSELVQADLEQRGRGWWSCSCAFVGRSSSGRGRSWRELGRRRHYPCCTGLVLPPRRTLL